MTAKINAVKNVQAKRKNNFVTTRIIGNKNMTGKRGRSEKGGWLNMEKFVGGNVNGNGQKQEQTEDEHTVEKTVVETSRDSDKETLGGVTYDANEHPVECSGRTEDQVAVARDKVIMMSSAGVMMTAATKEHPVGTGDVEVVRGKGKYRANEHPVDMNIPERKVEKIRKFFEVENVGKEKSTESEKVVNNTFETNCKVIREHPVDCDKPAPVLKRGGGVKVPA